MKGRCIFTKDPGKLKDLCEKSGGVCRGADNCLIFVDEDDTAALFDPTQNLIYLVGQAFYLVNRAQELPALDRHPPAVRKELENASVAIHKVVMQQQQKGG